MRLIANFFANLLDTLCAFALCNIKHGGCDDR